MDVLNDPSGRDHLLKLGVRHVPVVARGDKFVSGQLIERVAEFVGIAANGKRKLPAEELVARYRIILQAAQRLIAQVPRERINERVIQNRDRTIRLMCHHIFRIAESFIEAWDGADYTAQFGNSPPGDDAQTPEEIIAYGASVRTKVDAWWGRVEDKSCQKVLKTFFGSCVAHDLLERSTWHSAQHCRQLADVLKRFGIEPDQPLTQDQLAGLPLPERLYE